LAGIIGLDATRSKNNLPGKRDFLSSKNTLKIPELLAIVKIGNFTIVKSTT